MFILLIARYQHYTVNVFENPNTFEIICAFETIYAFDI